MAIGSKSKSTQTFERLDKLRKGVTYPLTVRIPMGMKQKLERIAGEQDRRMSEIVRQFIVEGMGRL